MNIRNILLSVAAGALACSCNFSEDDCIRLGHLRAYCNFAEIEAKDIPVPTRRHLIAYGISDKTLELPEKKTFTQDTLKWDLPRGDYDFIFLSGNNEIRNMQSYRDCQLYSAITEADGKIYLTEKQTFVCKQLFQEHFDYQKETVKEIITLPFTQTIIIRLHVSGNINPLTGITSELDGVAVSKFLVSNELSSEYATMTSDYIKEQEENIWVSTNYVLGINQSTDNVLRVITHTTDTSNDTYNIDLTPYLQGFDKYKMTIDLNLVIGKSLTIDSPVIIEDWADGTITDLN